MKPRFTKKYTKVLSCILILSFIFCGAINKSCASALIFASDTISTSAPSAFTNHTIVFTATSSIPVSGKITIVPESGYFTIPSNLDYTDLDISIIGVEQTLAASPGSGAGSAIGASVTIGTSGSIIFTLNNTDAITSGSAIIIKIGTNASYGTAGDLQIQNPSAVGSYKISLQTRNGSNIKIDGADVMLAIVAQVSASASNVACGIADLDCDGDVDLTDFSIAAYWYGQTLSADFAVIESERLNDDGQINLVDFSIMAYYYTG